MTEWIIPCNVRTYDIMGAFSEFEKINWKQSSAMEPGDIVYIYVGKPYSAIKFQCRVNKINLSEIEIDDSKYVIDGTNYVSYKRHMELVLLQKYATSLLRRENLIKNGLKQIQGPQRVTQKLSIYIAQRINTFLNEVEDKNFLEEVNHYFLENSDSVSVESSDVYEDYPAIKKEKRFPIIKNGQRIYNRDKKAALNALKRAHYSCEINPAHPTFIRKNSNKNYTEPHHLIPLSYSDNFHFSLDVEQNIVSLCSTCHDQIHYGEGAALLLEKLYKERKEYLKEAGIEITLNDLLDMYQ